MFYVLSLTMGRVYVITLLVNLLVSRRATSPYAVPVGGVPRRKLSFSAEMMMTFSACFSCILIVEFTLRSLFVHAAMPRLAPREKQLPPTPTEVRHAVGSGIRQCRYLTFPSFIIFFLNRRLKRFDAHQRSGTGDAPFVLTLVTQYAMLTGLSKNNLPYLATRELNIEKPVFLCTICVDKERMSTPRRLE